MDPEHEFSAQLLAMKADQQATQIVLRGLLKAEVVVAPLRRGELVRRIRIELDRFAIEADDAGWRNAVTALVEAHVDDLLRDELRIA